MILCKQQIKLLALYRKKVPQISGPFSYLDCHVRAWQGLNSTKKGIHFGYPLLVLLRARDGTRTRDPDLGKVVLHKLSHSRILFEVYTLKTTY